MRMEEFILLLNQPKFETKDYVQGTYLPGAKATSLFVNS